MQIRIKNVLFLTDFSQASEAALPFALSVATAYESNLCALHVITPPALDSYSAGCGEANPKLTNKAAATREELAQGEMQRIDSRMAGLSHETVTLREGSVWSAVERVLGERDFDLLVLGTHGRTGQLKLLIGSVAEEIFRRSLIPVLTIGPHVRSGTPEGGRFHRLLFATDFTPASLAALPWAISLAQENLARLTLLNVVFPPDPDAGTPVVTPPAASLLGDLHELVPKEAQFWCRPEPFLAYGEPGETIVATASQVGADLIVLGVRGTPRHIEVTTHTGKATAHSVVAHAECPVLTVRG
jgi:nucleotide-binding universal stress UspA family protein